MKYTILGFSQSKSVEYGLKVEDLLILRYFVDFKDSGNMTTKVINNEIYYWVQYDKIKSELPILNIKKDMVYRKLKNLADIDILNRVTLKENGTYSFYKLGSKYKYLISDYTLPEKIPEGYGKNSGPPPEKIPEGYGKNSGTNNSSINNTSINNKYIVEIIDFFNTTCGTNYRATSKNTKKFINARLNEKFTVDNFKTVIVKKFNDWNGTEYEKYLRPETLFGTKFEMYLNQKERRNNIVATTNSTDTKYDFTPREPTDGEIPDVDF